MPRLADKLPTLLTPILPTDPTQLLGVEGILRQAKASYLTKRIYKGKKIAELTNSQPPIKRSLAAQCVGPCGGLSGALGSRLDGGNRGSSGMSREGDGCTNTSPFSAPSISGGHVTTARPKTALQNQRE